MVGREDTLNYSFTEFWSASHIRCICIIHKDLHIQSNYSIKLFQRAQCQQWIHDSNLYIHTHSIKLLKEKKITHKINELPKFPKFKLKDSLLCDLF